MAAGGPKEITKDLITSKSEEGRLFCLMVGPSFEMKGGGGLVVRGGMQQKVI